MPHPKDANLEALAGNVAQAVEAFALAVANKQSYHMLSVYQGAHLAAHASALTFHAEAVSRALS